MTEIFIAAISGAVTLLGVLISNSRRAAITDEDQEEIVRSRPGTTD